MLLRTRIAAVAAVTMMLTSCGGEESSAAKSVVTPMGVTTIGQYTTRSCKVKSLAGEDASVDVSKAQVAGVSELRFAIPEAEARQNAKIMLIAGERELTALRLEEATDLYDRDHVLARISGAIAEGHLDPTFSVVATFDTFDKDGSGFAEITETGADGAKTKLTAVLEGCPR